MNRRTFLTATLLALPTAAAAEARYADKVEMIREAEIIAVVDITRVRFLARKGREWRRRQAAEATVEKVLKGRLPEQVTLSGNEDFICARTLFKPGRHLVFLRRDGDLLWSSNWQLGVRPITGDTVEWVGEQNVFNTVKAPLAEVTARIKRELQAAPRRS